MRTRNRRIVAVTGTCMAMGLAANAQAAGFIDDSTANLSIRNTYYNDDYREGKGVSRLKEWGQGFQLNLQSGFTQGVVGFGVDAIGQYGIRLDGGGHASSTGPGTDFSANADSIQPTNMFPRNRDGSSVGEFGSLSLAAKMRFSKTEVRTGVLQPTMPVLSYIEGRLLPQTFQGTQVTSKEIDKLKITFGQVEKVKDRGSSNYDSLRISGATNDSNKFEFAGADYQLNKHLTLQYYYGNLQDFYQQHFLGSNGNWSVGPGTLKMDLRYFHSTAAGANADGNTLYSSSGYYNNGLTTRGKIDNDLYSGLFTYSYLGHSLSLGYQKSEGQSYFPSVNSGAGSYAYIITDGMLGRFGAAGERAWQARYFYDFAAVGVPGLMTGMHYTKGNEIKALNEDRSEFERILFFGYTIQSGPLHGLSAMLTQSTYKTDQTGIRNQQESKMFIQYQIALK